MMAQEGCQWDGYLEKDATQHMHMQDDRGEHCEWCARDTMVKLVHWGDDWSEKDATWDKYKLVETTVSGLPRRNILSRQPKR